MAESILEMIFRTKKTGDGEQQAQSGLKGLGGAFEELTGVSLTAAGGIAAATAAVGFMISSAAEAEVIGRQLDAVIKSTGGAAGLTADEVEGMSARLSELTSVEDDTITKAAAVMLTFTKIGEEVFPDAQMAALNISAALGQDLQGSVVQLGKALNDPITGITALSRVGVSFTQEQKEMIKTLVETGDVMGAQRIILNELNTEFGGAAEAMANTYTGKVNKLKNAFGNLAEMAGGPLIDGLGKATDAMLLLMQMNDKIAAALDDHGKEVVKTIGTYEEYEAEMARALEASGRHVKVTENGIEVFRVFQGYVQVTGTELGILTEAEWEAARAEQELAYAAQDAAEDHAMMSRELAYGAEAGTRLAEAALEAAAAEQELAEQFDLLSQAVGGRFGKEIDKFNDKLGDLKDTNRELVAKIAELEGKSYLTPDQKKELEDAKKKLGENRQAITELLDEHTRAMSEMAFNMLMQQAASDGLTENEVANMTEIAVAWGLWDEKTAAVVTAVNQNMDKLDTETPEEMLTILNGVMDLPEEKDIHLGITVEGLDKLQQAIDYWHQLFGDEPPPLAPIDPGDGGGGGGEGTTGLNVNQGSSIAPSGGGGGGGLVIQNVNIYNGMDLEELRYTITEWLR